MVSLIGKQKSRCCLGLPSNLLTQSALVIKSARTTPARLPCVHRNYQGAAFSQHQSQVLVSHPHLSVLPMSGLNTWDSQNIHSVSFPVTHYLSYHICKCLYSRTLLPSSLDSPAIRQLLPYAQLLRCFHSTLCSRMDGSPPGSSVQGIFQVRMVEWVAISCSRGYSSSRDWTCVSCIDRRILYCSATREPTNKYYW